MSASGLELVTDFQYYKKTKIREVDAVAAYVCQLGDEGWELTQSRHPNQTQISARLSHIRHCTSRGRRNRSP